MVTNNFVDYLANLTTSSPKRSNWNKDFDLIGTNTFGPIKVRLCKEVVAGTGVDLNFKAAYSTNPAITPVLSRAKVEVVAFWIPSRLYVPAFRDGVRVGPDDDYAFPVISIPYEVIKSAYYSDLSSDIETFNNGAKVGQGYPYVPAGSLWHALRMFPPYFQPAFLFDNFKDTNYRDYKNAIPLLGYLDIVRNYFLNTQQGSIPFVSRGYSRRFVQGSVSDQSDRWETQSPTLTYKSRNLFDTLFSLVRQQGSDYQTNGSPFDITSQVSEFFGYYFNKTRVFLPTKSCAPVNTDEPVGPGNIVAFNDSHACEFICSYMPDFFNSYISNENVEYERSTARVKVDDEGVFTMEQLYAQQRIQNFIRRSVFNNNGYEDFVHAEYGITPPSTLTKPMFLGSSSTWLYWNDVIAQSQSGDSDFVDSNSALGSRASLGRGRLFTGKYLDEKGRSFVRFTAKEPGYLMVLEMIIPELFYWTTYDPMYDKTTLHSLYYPAFDRDGYQDKQSRYIVGDTTNDLDATIYGNRPSKYNLAYANEPAWWEYMRNHNIITDDMCEEGVYRHWSFHYTPTISLRFDGTDNPQAITPNSLTALTYTNVDICAHNTIFANLEGIDNIQCYYSFDYKEYQPLSHRFLSY